MSDARERLIEAGERVLDRYPSGGLLARLLLDCWTSEEHAPDLRAVLSEWDGYWMNRALHAEAERDALRSEHDEAVALLRQYPESVRALDSASHRRWRRDRHAFLARIEGSDK